MKGYLQELDALVRSMIVKSSHQSEMINKNILKTYGSNYLDQNDYTSWRYYLNLNGEYHYSNARIEVYVIELGETRKLTKELLEANKKTKQELSLYATTYLKLVAQYPSEELLIKGIINPIDMATAYNANDGEILGYNHDFIGSYENDIMTRLNVYSKNIYYRWFNPYYIDVAEFYVATFLSYLYASYLTKLDTMRLENIHTHRVNKYHMDYFFKSNLDITTTYMNHKSKLWLYQNLRTLMVHVGKDETLEQIIDNVLTPNRVGVGKLLLDKAKPTKLELNNDNNLKSNFDIENITQLMVDSRNQYYNTDGLTLTEVINMQVENRFIHETVYNELDDLLLEVETRLKDNNEIALNTKLLHLVGKEDRDILPFPRINMILDSLFYIATQTVTDFDVTYLDVNTNVSYKLTFNQAIKLLAYLLSRYANIETNSITIESNSVVKKTYTDVKHLMIEDNTNFEYIDLLNSYRPSLYAINYSTDYIVDYIQSAMDYFIVDWLIKSSLINYTSIANLNVLDAHNHNDLYTLDFTGILEDTGVNITSSYDYLTAIKTLIGTVTANRLQLDLNEVNMGSINSYVDLLRKTTSYNLQVIGTTIVGNSLNMFDEGFGLLSGPVILDIHSSYFNGLEDLQCNVEKMDLSDVKVYNRTNNQGYILSELQPSLGMAVVGGRSMLRDAERVKIESGPQYLFGAGKVIYNNQEIGTKKE